MTHTFIDALTAILKEEGGFVDDARDRGGATNLGVTARAWHCWTGQCPTNDAMRALTIPKVAAFYKALYWDKIAGSSLPISLALVVFDFAVDADPIRSVGLLQGVVGSPKSGQAGATTLNAAQTYAKRIGLKKLIVRFCDARRDSCRDLPAFSVFGKGWLARVDRIEAKALSWLR